VKAVLEQQVTLCASDVAAQTPHLDINDFLEVSAEDAIIRPEEDFFMKFWK
jgi:hypothetical protein